MLYNYGIGFGYNASLYWTGFFISLHIQIIRNCGDYETNFCSYQNNRQTRIGDYENLVSLLL